MNDVQALELIVNLFNSVGSYGSQLALAIAILSGIMTLIKRWTRLDTIFNKLPKSYKSFVPLVIGGLIGLCQGFMPFIGLGALTIAILNGVFMVGGGQTVLYQQTKHTPVEKLTNAILNPLFKDGKFPLANILRLIKK